MHVGVALGLARGARARWEAHCIPPARHELSFESGGTACAAWHYAGDAPGPRACVVLAHGFTMTRDAGLAGYAERFVAAVVSQVPFSGLGGGEGPPRRLGHQARMLAAALRDAAAAHLGRGPLLPRCRRRAPGVRGVRHARGDRGDAGPLDVRRHDDEHFAVYTGEPFERFVAEQVAFLTEHVG